MTGYCFEIIPGIERLLDKDAVIKGEMFIVSLNGLIWWFLCLFTHNKKPSSLIIFDINEESLDFDLYFW
jgi:hypothetical protein